MATYVKIRIDANLIRKVGRYLARETREAEENGHIGQALHAAAMIYMGFTRERYVEQSRGAGEWPPLSPATIERRRKGRDVQGRDADVTAAIFAARGVPASEASILIDTATLLGSITPGAAKTERKPAGIRVGTEVEYAQYHQFGDGVPKREIFVQPSVFTLMRIEQALVQGYERSVVAFTNRNRRR